MIILYHIENKLKGREANILGNITSLVTSKVLITGFEPFLEFTSNPSRIVAEYFEGRVEDNIEYHGKVLPVDYSLIESRLVESIDKINPDIIIGTGLAAGRSKMSIEKIGINYKHSTSPDNSGKTVNGEKIDPDLPDGIFSMLHVESLVEYLNSKGIPAEMSFSAGSYLCNNALFLILRECRKRNIRGGFIHLPVNTEYVTKLVGKNYPSLPVNLMIEGIRQIIQTETRKI